MGRWRTCASQPETINRPAHQIFPRFIRTPRPWYIPTKVRYPIDTTLDFRAKWNFKWQNVWIRRTAGSVESDDIDCSTGRFAPADFNTSDWYYEVFEKCYLCPEWWNWCTDARENLINNNYYSSWPFVV